MQDSASVCVHPDTISGTHDVNNVLKKLEVQETSIQESKPNDGGSSLRGLADINTNPGCVQKSVKGGLGGVVYTRTQYDDVVYVGDTTAVQKLLKLKSDIDEMLVHTKNVQSKNVGWLEFL